MVNRTEYTEGYKNAVEYATKTRVGYMCKTEFDHELGSTDSTVYPSIATLLRENPCVHECGIVKVEVRLLGVVDWGSIEEEVEENS